MWFSLRLRTWVPVRMSHLFRRVFTLFVFHIQTKHSPTLAGVSVPVPQTANTTAGVQVEHTEVKKHYNTLNGYCDHHKSTPPRPQFEEVCARVCDTALLWQKSHLTCVSVYECVLCVFIFNLTGMKVSLARRSPLLLLSSLLLCVQGKADWLTDKLMALMQCTASFFHFQSIWSIF